MKGHSAYALALIAATASQTASALVIDTNPDWDGNVSVGWAGSGQSLTVDATENRLESIGFYFDAESVGHTFDFIISDALNGGQTLFSTSLVVTSGISLVNVHRAFGPGSVIHVLIDYNGFLGWAAHYTYNDTYPGGNSSFGPVGSQNAFHSLEHRFVATFSVPEPGTKAAVGLALAGLGFLRRQRANMRPSTARL